MSDWRGRPTRQEIVDKAIEQLHDDLAPLREPPMTKPNAEAGLVEILGRQFNPGLREGTLIVPCGLPERAKAEIERLTALLSQARAEMSTKLRMIVAHATGGASSDIESSINDICVRISQHYNRVFQHGQEVGRAEMREEAAKVAESFGGEWEERKVPGFTAVDEEGEAYWVPESTETFKRVVSGIVIANAIRSLPIDGEQG